MLRTPFNFLIAFTLFFTLTACSSADSPKHAAELFWEAVQAQDMAQMQALSTQDSADNVMLNEQDAIAMSVKLSDTLINEDAAVVETRITQKDNDIAYTFNTYLLEEDGVWKVNYTRTMAAMRTSQAFAGLVADLREFNEELDENLSDATEAFKEALPEIREQLEEVSENAAQQIETFSEEVLPVIQEELESLSETIQQAFEAYQQRSQQTQESEE